MIDRAAGKGERFLLKAERKTAGEC